jgi:phosphotriesterase-related protein
MNRRTFLGSLASSLLPAAASSGYIHTVRGRIRPAGPTLVHEHVLVDFIGADKVSRERYDPSEVFRVALPFLERLFAQGCRTFVDCTPAYLGRDAHLLRRLSERSRLNIVTNTGYYGAADDKFVPAHAYRETPEQLSQRWIREFKDGIEGTGVRPGIIKIGVDRGSLSDIDAKLVRSAALTHRATGLTIASHTGDGVAALEELKLLRDAGVSHSAFIWVHAQNEADLDLHARAAAGGAWVEFDGLNEKTTGKHVQLVKHMIARGYLHRALLSHDAGWYHVGEPGGGSFRDYTYLFTDFVRALETAGVTKDQIEQILVRNPAEALGVRVRRA